MDVSLLVEREGRDDLDTIVGRHRQVGGMRPCLSAVGGTATINIYRRDTFIPLQLRGDRPTLERIIVAMQCDRGAASATILPGW